MHYVTWQSEYVMTSIHHSPALRERSAATAATMTDDRVPVATHEGVCLAAHPPQIHFHLRVEPIPHPGIVLRNRQSGGVCSDNIQRAMPPFDVESCPAYSVGDLAGCSQEGQEALRDVDPHTPVHLALLLLELHHRAILQLKLPLVALQLRLL